MDQTFSHFATMRGDSGTLVKLYMYSNISFLWGTCLCIAISDLHYCTFPIHVDLYSACKLGTKSKYSGVCSCRVAALPFDRVLTVGDKCRDQKQATKDSIFGKPWYSVCYAVDLDRDSLWRKSKPPLRLCLFFNLYAMPFSHSVEKNIIFDLFFFRFYFTLYHIPGAKTSRLALPAKKKPNKSTAL